MSVSRDVENYFRTRPNQTHKLDKLAKDLRLSPADVRSSLSYLRERLKKDDAIDIKVVKHGQAWRYNRPRLNAGQKAARAVLPNKVKSSEEVPPNTSPQLKFKLGEMLAIPATEPNAEFQIVGTLRISDELVLKGVSAGVEGVWLARRLY